MTDEDRQILISERERMLVVLENIEAAMLGDLQSFAADDENLDCDACVQTYLTLRETRERTKDRFEKRDATLRTMQRSIEAALGAHIQRGKLTGLNTRFGTVFTSPQSTAKVVDRDAYLSYLRENNSWELATLGSNKAEVAKFVENNDGTLPPGVDLTTRIAVQIRRK